MSNGRFASATTFACNANLRCVETVRDCAAGGTCAGGICQFQVAAGFCACSAAIRDMDQRADIAAITLPTLVVVGAEDPSTPVAAAELIHARIAGSRLVVLPDAAHLANIEQAAAFNAALLEFLAGLA